eukprot:5997242-Amphidinium_carterae.1
MSLPIVHGGGLGTLSLNRHAVPRCPTAVLQEKFMMKTYSRRSGRHVCPTGEIDWGVCKPDCDFHEALSLLRTVLHTCIGSWGQYCLHALLCVAIC